MTVEIPPQFQKFLHQSLDSGSYESEAAVINEALSPHARTPAAHGLSSSRNSIGVGAGQSVPGIRVGRQRAGRIHGDCPTATLRKVTPPSAG